MLQSGIQAELDLLDGLVDALLVRLVGVSFRSARPTTEQRHVVVEAQQAFAAIRPVIGLLEMGQAGIQGLRAQDSRPCCHAEQMPDDRAERP